MITGCAPKSKVILGNCVDAFVQRICVKCLLSEESYVETLFRES